MNFSFIDRYRRKNLKAKLDYKITFLTIVHRATLWQYHDYIIQFDGNGGWKFEEINSNKGNYCVNKSNSSQTIPFLNIKIFNNMIHSC